MTADLLRASLSELRRTADLLETGMVATSADCEASAVTVSDRRDPGPPEKLPLARFVARALVHTAITVAVLTGVTALVDPVLPHAGRPELSGPVEPSPTPIGDLLASPNTP